MTQNTTPLRVLGCDVARDSVVIYDSATASTQSVENSPQSLSRALRRFGHALVVCEATGGFEAALLAAAHQEGLKAHRGDPRKISAFLRSLRSHGKTDPIDARGLARYGQERYDQLTLWQPPSKTQKALQQLIRLRADMVSHRADYIRRLKAPEAGAAIPHIEALIQSLDQRIADMTRQINRLVAADRRISAMVHTISKIPGCGLVTASTLVAIMPEIGTLSRRQAASLSGTAPHPRSSGQRNAYTPVRGGRLDIKKTLFMAALAARRYNPELRTFYERLIANGKKPIVAIVAIARKLITIINAKLRDALPLLQQQLS